jgi:hypothetical protein
MSSAFELASSIRKWALSHNLVDSLPNLIESHSTAQVNSAVMPEEAEDTLRTKGITSIAYNDIENKVFVYTKKSLTKKDISKLSQQIGNCSIYYAQGNISALGVPPHQAQGATSHIITLPSGTSHYCCGSSISPGNAASAGTLGALVRNKSGEVFGLTNNHVTGACSHSLPNLPIVAPGIIDVNPNNLHPFTIGTHARTLEMVPGVQGNVDIYRNTDAAIFSIKNESLVSSMQGNEYDTPTNVLDPMDGMIVEKIGRTTNHTKGVIIGRDLVPFPVFVQAPLHGFSAQIWFSGSYIEHGENDVFSESGDSGSLVVTKDSNGNMSSVGLLFAGGSDSIAPGKMRTLILPLRPILERLDVELIGGLNVSTTTVS